MQRPERIVLIGVAALACGITAHYIGGNYKLFIKGIPFHVFEPMSIFTVPIFAMAVLTNLTAIARLRESKIELDKKDRQKKENIDQIAATIMLQEYLRNLS